MIATVYLALNMDGATGTLLILCRTTKCLLLHLELCPTVASVHVEVIVSVSTFSTLNWLHVFIVLAYILQGHNCSRHSHPVFFLLDILYIVCVWLCITSIA